MLHFLRNITVKVFESIAESQRIMFVSLYIYIYIYIYIYLFLRNITVKDHVDMSCLYHNLYIYIYIYIYVYIYVYICIYI